MKKIIRSICYFQIKPDPKIAERLDQIESKLIQSGFDIQTKRLCSPHFNLQHSQREQLSLLYSIGTITLENALNNFQQLMDEENISFNIELNKEIIAEKHVEFLFKIINTNASKTFNFTYVFNNAHSSPYFPSAAYHQDGFSIGLQPTDLSSACNTIEEWLNKQKEVWHLIVNIFKDDHDFLGIDTSVAPLLASHSSLIYFIKRLGIDFNKSFCSSLYSNITDFIKINNPHPIGLNGLMMPCLEDFELAHEYSMGNFSIERNIFVSLHSGLGIDTYPIGINENKEDILNVLKLLQALSNKYKKPLSARFVSDGKASIGEQTSFNNPYLKDVIVRPLHP